MHQAKHIPIVNHQLRRSLVFLAAALLLILAVSLTTQGESGSPPRNLLIRDLRIFGDAPAIFKGNVWIQKNRSSALALWYVGGRGRRAYYVMIFTQSGGFIPKTVAVSADADRMEIRLPVSRFGTDGQDRTAIFMSLPGHFNLLIDHLQFQNKPAWEENSECESQEL